MAKRAGAGSPAAMARVGDQVGYARVSTRDQTVALQLDALNAAGCVRMFEETASGAQRDRPQLAAALDWMRAGDTLMVWKLDRLARSTRQLIKTVEKLARRGVGFRCLTQDIDTTTAGGRLVFTIFSAIAEFERAIIQERTRAGLDAARARGRRSGRPPALKLRDLKEARARCWPTRRSPASRSRPGSRCRRPRSTATLPGGRGAVQDAAATGK